MNPVFRRLHPFTCFTFYLGFILLSMILLHPLFLLTGIMGIIIMINLHGGGSLLKKYFPYYLGMGGIVAIANPLFNHRGSHVLFTFWDQPVTLEAVLYGLIMMLSLLSILLVFISFNMVLTPNRFLFLFANRFNKSALLMMLSVRFVPLLKRRLTQILTIQKTRGIDPMEGPLKKRMTDGMLILQLLVTWSLEEAFQTADSMTARGYGVKAHRGHYVPYRWDQRNQFILLLLILCSGSCLIGWLMGYGTFAVYPRLGTFTFQLWDAFFYFCFLFFILIPIVLEGREKMKWLSSMN